MSSLLALKAEVAEAVTFTTGMTALLVVPALGKAGRHSSGQLFPLASGQRSVKIQVTKYNTTFLCSPLAALCCGVTG